jgi:hypothetical protein
MTRALLTAIFVLGLPSAALALQGDGSAGGPPGRTFVLGIGDTMQIEGSSIGCQVSERDGRAVVECRRAGRLKRTYTTLFDDRRARVARFRSSDTAKVVFTARHGGRARKCGDAASARTACANGGARR